MGVQEGNPCKAEKDVRVANAKSAKDNKKQRERGRKGREEIN